MKWHDNLLLEGGTPDLAFRGQFQLAMYALHLSSGHSIYCKRICAATIEQYVFAAASFLTLFTGVDFRKDLPSDKHMGHILAPIYRDLKKYETVPNRREGYNPDMHMLARTVASRLPRDSLAAALTDGFEQGYSAGFRLSEWAQPAGRSDPMTPQLNHLVSAALRTRAIVPVDVRVQTIDYRRAVGLPILLIPLAAITRLWVTFRTQKNGQHGEEKLFMLNPNPAGICLVSATYRALERFKRLQRLDPRLDPRTTPLSVYWDGRARCVKLITATEIERFMRNLASSVFNLHPVRNATELSKWSSHSLRVGACIALHANGFSALDIQWILRWRSMAFMVYLRNMAVLAIRHHQALDRTAALPLL